MKKRLTLVLLLFLLVFSMSVLAADDSCSGFWGSIGCFLWGDSSARAGASWFDRGALVGR